MPLRKLITFTLTIPSIAIGVLAMYQNHVPVAIWGQNIGCLILMSVISLFMITHKCNNTGNRYNQLLLPVAIIALILTPMDIYRGSKIKCCHDCTARDSFRTI